MLKENIAYIEDVTNVIKAADLAVSCGYILTLMSNDSVALMLLHGDTLGDLQTNCIDAKKILDGHRRSVSSMEITVTKVGQARVATARPVAKAAAGETTKPTRAKARGKGQAMRTSPSFPPTRRCYPVVCM